MKMKEYFVDGHEPSFLPDGVKLKLSWQDEFDGDTLDTSKWGFRRAMMGNKWMSWTDSEKALEAVGDQFLVDYVRAFDFEE